MSDIITSQDIHDFLNSTNSAEARDRLGFIPVDGAAVDGTSIDFDTNGDIRIKPAGIYNIHLTADSVSSDNLTTDSVTEGSIVDGSVTEGKVGFQAVTSDKLAANSVTESKIDSGSITTSKLVDGAVTKAKMEQVPHLHVLGNTSGTVDTPKDVTILDDSSMLTASNTTLATSKSIKEYVNSENVRVSDKHLKYSGSAGNFSATDSYTDFDLSTIVGVNRALVVLEIYGGSNSSYFHVRTKGSNVTWSDTAGTGWGSSVVVVGPNNQGGTVTVVTDDSGVFQHRADSSITGIQYTIQTYQLIDSTEPSGTLVEHVRVSDAGSTELNGIYLINGEHDGVPKYTLFQTDGTTEVCTLRWDSPVEQWNFLVRNPDDSITPMYYTDSVDGASIPDVFYNTGSAIDPVPTVERVAEGRKKVYYSRPLS